MKGTGICFSSDGDKDLAGAELPPLRPIFTPLLSKVSSKTSGIETASKVMPAIRTMDLRFAFFIMKGEEGMPDIIA